MNVSESFSISGFFYVDEEGYPCRKYLDIVRKNACCLEPEVMVVMMNPGSSTPINGIDDGCELTEAYPDPAQDQIMELMLKKSINFARILNLSDLRNPESSQFYSLIKKDRNDTKHCIFDDSRQEDLEILFIKNVPTIFAWGVDSSLKKLSDLAINKLKIEKPLGVLNKYQRYLHASPRLKSDKEHWLARMLDLYVADE